MGGLGVKPRGFGDKAPLGWVGGKSLLSGLGG